VDKEENQASRDPAEKTSFLQKAGQVAEGKKKLTDLKGGRKAAA